MKGEGARAKRKKKRIAVTSARTIVGEKEEEIKNSESTPIEAGTFKLLFVGVEDARGAARARTDRRPRNLYKSSGSTQRSVFISSATSRPVIGRKSGSCRYGRLNGGVVSVHIVWLEGLVAADAADD